MKKNISLWQLVGFAVTTLAGTLLHFLYELSGEAGWAALISGVNESTWEHMKLLFFPLFVFAIAESFAFRDRPDFWCVKLRGILLGLILIPILFYTYNGAVGESPDWVNISIFFVSAAAAFIYETRALREPASPCRSPGLQIFALCLLAVAFVIFTFVTPELGLFKDPLTGGYGIDHALM